MQKFIKFIAGLIEMGQQLTALLKGWIPWRLAEAAHEPMCEWLYKSDQKFTAPFFDDTIRTCRTLPENKKKYKPVSDLAVFSEWGKQFSAAHPSAVIFHVSRCGSTLLSQLLCCDDNNIVLSEVPFIDQLLRLKFKKEKYNPEQIDEYVKSAINIYGATYTEQRLFIKADSWHLYFYEQYRKLYPDTLFVLLYREPLAVIQSQQKQRGLHAVPGLLEPELFDLTITEKYTGNFNVYMADVLQAYYRKIISIASADENILLVNYRQGMQDIVAELYRLLQIQLNDETKQLLEERNHYHAKRADQVFSEEKPIKPLPFYIDHCFNAYEKLEQMRLAKG